jgi:arylsulfatase A-like enzyme
LAVNEAWKGKSGLNNAAADLIMETDAAVGQVLAALEKSGAASNTLVLFTSDNGFASYVGVKDLKKQGHFPSGPLRDYKSSVYEGGHREPFIVRWPGKVTAASTCDQLVHHADLIATLADIWGTALPPEAGEDSFSFLPLLKGASKPTRYHAISCAAAGTPGLRLGQWKYIATQPAQLYDLATDLGETKNLADEQTERVAEMKLLLEKLITDGRSTAGEPQKNDVEVVRYPKASTPKAKTAKKPISK